jgi:hypothetical protein
MFTATTWSIAIVIWILCGIGAYFIARDRGSTSPGGWFVAGILFGPLGLIGAFFAGPGGAMVAEPSRWSAPSALTREYRGDSEPQARAALEGEVANAARSGYAIASAEWVPVTGYTGILRVTLEPLPPTPPASASGSLTDRLAQLDQARTAGVVSDEEYASKRAQILTEH